MEKIKVLKQVVETKEVDVYRAFDGAEFANERDCLEYEKSSFDKQAFQRNFNISIINNYDVVECISRGLEYSLDDYSNSLYKVTIPKNYWDKEFDSEEFTKYFKLYFGINDDDFVITNVGELIFIISFDYSYDSYSYHFISKDELIVEFNKKIETIKNL